jgi:hypothetical protein
MHFRKEDFINRDAVYFIYNVHAWRRAFSGLLTKFAGATRVMLHWKTFEQKSN